MKYDYEYFMVSADYIRSKLNGFEPDIGLILGSGLGHFGERIENKIEIPYRDIPNYLVSTAPSHAGKFIFGTVGGRRVMCMSGRFHSYEGYEFSQLTTPIRVMKLMGVKEVISTCAAGAINPDYKIGDIMIIKDHIKMTCESPLVGPNDDAFGPRFFDMSNAYDKDLRALALELGKDTPLRFREGVYFFFTGPQYETPAEIRAARILGGDAAGMSMVTETLTAAHCGLPYLGLAVMCNMAAGVSKVKLTEQDVIDAGEAIAEPFEIYVENLIRKMP